MPDLNYVVMKLADLNPAQYNPRKITEEALGGLENTIEEFGLVQNLVWNKRTGNLVGGHQRMKALSNQNITEAMVCVVDLSLEREKALNVALNNPHIAGTFDDGLQDLLRDIRDNDTHLFRDIHLDKLLKDEASGTPDEDDVPEPPEEPVSKLGDLWILGEHRLLCGSSTEHSDVMRLIGDRHAVCCWTDPPYGVDYVGGTKEKKTIKNDGKEGLPDLLNGCFKLAFDYVMAPGSAIYVAHPDVHQWTFHKALETSEFKFRQMLIWAKNTFALGRRDYHYSHEAIWYGYKPSDETFGRMHGGSGWHGDHSQGTVFQVDKPKRNGEHPTMKPVALVVKMLSNSTRPLDWVYEPFCGSGTTLIACEQLGRRCMGMELDPVYVDVIVKRWEEQTGQKAVLEGSQPLADSSPETDGSEEII